MFLIDDILLSPVKGLLLVFEEIHHAVNAELSDTQGLIERLQELYMLLETEQITTAEFDEREATLLDQLDRAQGQPAADVDEEEREKL